MNIGLLLCDHVSEENQVRFGDYPVMFSKLFPSAKFTYFEVTQGDFPAHIGDCEAYIATGSRASVYEDKVWIHETKNFVKTLHAHKKKFLGVCFGHQLIAEALDGKVEKAQTGWSIGVHEIALISQQSWMDPFVPKLNILMMCQDQVVTLPSGSTLLAQAPFVPFAMYQVGNHMLSIQGHPEFSKAFERQIIEERVLLLGEEKAAKGLESLALPIQSKTFATWALNFLMQ